MELLEITGNCWNGQKWMELGSNGWKLVEMDGMAVICLNWLEMAGNAQQLLEMAVIFGKLLKMAVNGLNMLN